MDIYTLEKEEAYYSSDRKEIIAMFPDNVSSVLDVGCGDGLLGRQLKAQGIKKVIGIEVNRAAAGQAKKHLDDVIVADVENAQLAFADTSFDVIICADVLEHLVNPWETLKRLNAFLLNDGFFLISIPNIRYYRVLYKLIFKGEFKYEDQGILDITHLRFFTFKMLKAYMSEIDFKIVKVKRNFSGHISWLSNAFFFNLFADFFTRQYIILAKHKGREE